MDVKICCECGNIANFICKCRGQFFYVGNCHVLSHLTNGSMHDMHSLHQYLDENLLINPHSLQQIYHTAFHFKTFKQSASDFYTSILNQDSKDLPSLHIALQNHSQIQSLLYRYPVLSSLPLPVFLSLFNSYLSTPSLILSPIQNPSSFSQLESKSKPSFNYSLKSMYSYLKHKLKPSSMSSETILKYNTEQVTSISITQDSKYLISGSIDGAIHISNLTSLSKHTSIPSRKKILNLAVCPGNRHIIACYSSRVAKIFNIESRLECLHIPLDSKMNGVTFSHNGRYLFIWSVSSAISIYDMYTFRKLAVLKHHSKWVNAFCVTYDDSYFISSSLDKTLKICTMQDLTIHKVILTTHVVICLAVTRNNEYLLACTWGSELFIYNMHKHYSALRIYLGYYPSCMCLSRDDRYLYISGGDPNQVRQYQFTDMNIMREFNFHRENISTMALSHDGKMLVTGSWDCTIRIWDTRY